MVRHYLQLGAVTTLVVVTVGVGHAQELTIEDLRAKANQGAAEAEYSLGQRYANGEGVPQDYAQARPLFERAALQGYAPAEHSLGVLYADGLGGPQDYGLARQWYGRATSQAYALAEYNLGLLYEEGLGGEEDLAEAARLYRLAADQGLARAQKSLAVLYDFGRGVTQNYGEGVIWYRLAAEQAQRFFEAGGCSAVVTGCGVNPSGGQLLAGVVEQKSLLAWSVVVGQPGQGES